MTKLPKYVCITCGQGFTTARSGRRHIAGIEHGNGYITREADYRVLLLTGRIPPPIPKLIRQKPSEKKEKDPLEIAQEEFLRGFYNRMGVRTYEEYANTPEISKFKNILLTRSMRLLQKSNL
jgi:hypothetical protein